MIDRISATHMLAALGFLAASLAAGRLEAQAPPAPPPALLPRPFPAPKPSDPKPAAPPPYPPPRAGEGREGGSQPARGGREPDLAYRAYQRRYFLTPFAEATRRVDEKSAQRPLTLLGELYSNGLCVPLAAV